MVLDNKGPVAADGSHFVFRVPGGSKYLTVNCISTSNDAECPVVTIGTDVIE